MKQTLYIGHNIFLNKEQRYNLYYGKKIKVIGFNISCNSLKKYNCIECFSQYYLIPRKKIKNKIKKNNKGYTIYIENLNMFSIFDFLFTEKNKNNFSAKDLINIKDGGKEWTFIKQELNEINHNTIHTIEIQKIENLLSSL